MNVLDASALLAFVHDEDGAAAVEESLVDGAIVGAANWSEVAQKVTSSGADWTLVASLLDSYGIEIAPIERVDAEAAAAMWKRGAGLSLADRLCLALGHRVGSPILTADAAWGEDPPVVQIR